MFLKFLYLISLLNIVDSFNIAIVGASSGLGKELVFKGVTEKNLDILAFTSKTKIYKPYRGDSFEEKGSMDEFVSDKVKIENYWNDISDYSYENLIFCTSAKPFENDYSDKLTLKYLENLPDACKDVSIVSAYSVEENNLEKFSIPFQIMSNIYLKDVYRAKREQERLIKQYNASVVRKKIFKPRALSYVNTFLPSTTRMELAEEILDTL